MIKSIRTVILTVGTAAAAYAGASAPLQGETVPLVSLARDPEAWRGREVRTCGPEFSGDSKEGVWELARPKVSGYHPAIVRVVGCAGVAPVRDSGGCLSGRVARRNGSIEPVAEGEPQVVSSAIMSYDWYLHAQCPAPRRD